MFADKAMSRYRLQEDRGCFCCEPTAPHGACSQGMLNQQLQDQDTPVSSGPSAEANNPFVVHTHHIQADGLGLSYYPHGDDLSSQLSSQRGWNYLLGNNTSSNEIGMYQSEDSSGVFPPANNSPVIDDLRGQGSSWNFRILQNRELGSKISGIIINESKLLPSTSSTSGSGEYRIGMSDSVCDNTIVRATNKSLVDSMDIDSALDELGMLSTVTNSRKQYLLETRGQVSVSKHEQRLQSKSRSSPNLTVLSHPNGYRIIQMNTNFVTSLSDTLPLPNQTSSGSCNKSPLKSEFSHLKYRNTNVLEEPSRHRRSGPMMSRIHKDRFMYRWSRCPYKIPNRLCTSLQESDFRPKYFSTCASSIELSVSSSSTSSLEPGINMLSNKLTNCQQSSQSKSNTTSPLKPHVEMRLMRSLSSEDLTATCRCLEQELTGKDRGCSSTEQSLDMMTSQMTNLHMS